MAGGGGRARVTARRQAAGVDLDDAAFRAAIPEALHGIALRTEADLNRLGLKIQNEARKLCPVDTGRLRSSIQATPGRDTKGPYVNVGTNVNYATYVEYGTVHSAAQPYLRPALLLAGRWWRERAG
jgi:HK97 gp10 family phage protein